MRSLALAQQADSNTVRCLVPAKQAREMAPFRTLVTFRRSGRNLASIASFCWNFTRTCITFRPHVVHLHSTFAGVMGRILLLLLWPIVRPRIIYTPHAWAFIMEGSPARKKLYARIEKLLYPLTHKIICVSKYEAAEAARHGLPTHNTVVIYNGTPTITATGIPNPYNPNKLNLLFVGRLDFAKGFDVLLDAMQRLQQNLDAAHIHLTVIGEALESKAKPPQRPNITYTGWLSAEKLQPFYAHATAVVVPSRWEGFAMVPLEAMSHGTPVIISKIAAFPEIIENNVTGVLFTPGDSKELASIVLKTPKSQWQEMSVAARNAHSMKFKNDIMNAEIVKLYNEKLGA